MKKRMILKIYGVVQGVGFRYVTSLYARKLRICGFVMNNDDGTVDIIIEAEEKNLHKFLNFCYNGIKHARVDNIEMKMDTATDEFHEFIIKYY